MEEIRSETQPQEAFAEVTRNAMPHLGVSAAVTRSAMPHPAASVEATSVKLRQVASEEAIERKLRGCGADGTASKTSNHATTNVRVDIQPATRSNFFSNICIHIRFCYTSAVLTRGQSSDIIIHETD